MARRSALASPLRGIGRLYLNSSREQRYPFPVILTAHFAAGVGSLTPIGRATVDKLQLNRPGVVNLRAILRDAGEHPPRSG